MNGPMLNSPVPHRAQAEQICEEPCLCVPTVGEKNVPLEERRRKNACRVCLASALAQAAQEGAERQREADAKVAENEPECPGAMPEEMFDAMQEHAKDRQSATAFVRGVVHATKKSIGITICTAPLITAQEEGAG